MFRLQTKLNMWTREDEYFLEWFNPEGESQFYSGYNQFDVKSTVS